MKFIILFEDNPSAPADIRKIHMGQHLEFLERNSDVIDAAGPLTDKDGKGRDGLWIVDVEAHDDAIRLVQEDPFWATGLRKSFDIIAWKQVFAAGIRLINPR